MSAKRGKRKTGRPVAVPGEKSTKEKIFDAAVDLFAERGYDGVSIRDIGQAAGITEGAVYRHYASKDDILEAIFSYVEARIYSPPPEGSIDAMLDSMTLQQLLENMPRAMSADPHLMKMTRVMIIQMFHNAKIQDYVRRELFERPVDETDKLFRALAARGKIRPCDTRAMSTMFIAYLVYWYFQTFIFSDGASDHAGQSAQELIEAFAEMLKPEGNAT
jgi:Transcriptional regulator